MILPLDRATSDPGGAGAPDPVRLAGADAGRTPSVMARRPRTLRAGRIPRSVPGRSSSWAAAPGRWRGATGPSSSKAPGVGRAGDRVPARVAGPAMRPGPLGPAVGSARRQADGRRGRRPRRDAPAMCRHPGREGPVGIGDGRGGRRLAPGRAGRRMGRRVNCRDRPPGGKYGALGAIQRSRPAPSRYGPPPRARPPGRTLRGATSAAVAGPSPEAPASSRTSSSGVAPARGRPGRSPC
jgi:hypothetical protein